jgi:uncharacterized small protein (TIGR04563 family)
VGEEYLFCEVANSFILNRSWELLDPRFENRVVFLTGGSMAGSDKRKQSLYFPEEMLKEIQEEATRQDRSLSWIVQKAWKIARKEIVKYPSVNEFPGEDDERGSKEE